MTGIITSLPPLIEQPPGNNASNPAGLPGYTYTVALLTLPQTWTAPQTFADSDIIINGTTSGNLKLRAADVAGLSVVRFPAGSTDFSATGGTSQVIKQNSLGAPLTVGQLAFTDISGSAGAAQMPALTGDVTTVAGAVATTIAANAVTNAKAAQMAANTIKGNNIGSTANASDLTVNQTQILLGGWYNTRLAKTANYTVANADKGSTVALGGSAFYTLTFSAASGYDANFVVRVLNEDTGRGKTIACNGLSSFILWPGQSCTIFNQNNVWKVNPLHQPWMLESQPTFYVDPTNGSNTNDGLAAGAGNAFQTLAFAASNAYANVYTRDIGSIFIDGSSNTFQEFLTIFYQINGGGTLIFQNLTWKPITSGYCLQMGDYALVGLTNVTFSSAGVTTPVGYVTGHNYSILDVNAGCSVMGGISGSAFNGDYDFHVNINNGLTINAGTYDYLYNGSAPGSVWNINGTHTYVGTPTVKFAWASMGTKMQIQGNVTHSGALTAAVSKVNQGGLMQNLGASLPGGAPTPTTGGQYNTTTTA